MRILFLLFMPFFLNAQTLNQPQIKGGWINPNPGAYGTVQQAAVFWKALGIPTGDGAPSGTQKEDIKTSAIYFDSTSGNMYAYNPKTSSWVEISGGGGGGGNTGSTTQTFTGDGSTYDFTISTPGIDNFSAPVYLDYHPGDELPATQDANSVTLHYNLPPPAGQSFTVKIIYTTVEP